MRTLRPAYGEIPRRVSKPFLLFVGPVVLFIHHDEPERLQRREYGRPGSDDDARLPAVRGAPGVAAPARIQSRMHDHDAGAEAPLEAIDELRRERNFRHQHEHLAFLLERPGDHLQIHLRLAAPGDAVQKVRGEAAERGLDGFDHLSLRVGERDLGGPHREARRRGGDLFGEDPAALGRALDLRGLELTEIVQGRSAALRQKSQQRLLAGRALAGRLLELPPSGAAQGPRLDHGRRGLPGADAGGQCSRHDLSDRVVVVLGRPGQ